MENEEKASKSNKKIYVIVGVVVLILLILCIVFVPKLFKKDNKVNSNEVNNIVKGEYTLESNGLEEFDLFFLKLENETKNKIYSPLSIKYALGMLEEGSNGDTRSELSNILGSYKGKKYVNSKHMSLANGMFVRDTYKDQIKQEYGDLLESKYGASLVVDSFSSPDVINNWVNKRTLNLIPNFMDDVNGLDYVLINALGINMEWKNVIHPIEKTFYVNYLNEDYSNYISSLIESGGSYGVSHMFNGNKESNTLDFGISVNRYNIIDELGEDNIRKEVLPLYTKWYNGEEGKECDVPEKLEPKQYIEQYIKDIGSNYKRFDKSTDFRFNVTSDEKVFAKELKEYDGTTLEYIAIMPINKPLNEYIDDVKVDDINNLIKGLKGDKIEDYNDGVVTTVSGYVPTFKYSYELKLMDDLKDLGVKKVFDGSEADLTGMVKEKGAYINSASHKANIEFTNEGIKAAAATQSGGLGAASCMFIHNYKVPEEKIDLTFNKPFMYLIRDKETGEVWFTGTTYEADKYVTSE